MSQFVFGIGQPSSWQGVLVEGDYEDAVTALSSEIPAFVRDGLDAINECFAAGDVPSVVDGQPVEPDCAIEGAEAVLFDEEHAALRLYDPDREAWERRPGEEWPIPWLPGGADRDEKIEAARERLQRLDDATPVCWEWHDRWDPMVGEVTSLSHDDGDEMPTDLVSRADYWPDGSLNCEIVAREACFGRWELRASGEDLDDFIDAFNREYRKALSAYIDELQGRLASLDPADDSLDLDIIE